MDEVILNETGSVICKDLCDSMNEYDHPCDMCPINEALKKLVHYEDMEEAGRLIEVIRCKDCVNCREDTMFNVLYCQRDGYEVEPEHYCGFAKLKELEE
jgi:hypothetical protein